MPDWVRTTGNDGCYSESLNGVLWAYAKLPPRWHRCKPQTRRRNSQGYTERCRCGAYRHAPAGPWADTNQARRDRRKERRDARARKVQVTCSECGRQYEAGKGSDADLDRLCHLCWGKHVGEAGLDA